MRRIILSFLLGLVCITAVFGQEKPDPKPTATRWTPLERKKLEEGFDAAWRNALAKKLVPAGKRKPIILTLNEIGNLRCGNEAAVAISLLDVDWASGDIIIFCDGFRTVQTHDVRTFIFDHEIAHALLGDFSLLVFQGDEEAIERECAANVFAARLSSPEFVIRMIGENYLERSAQLEETEFAAFTRAVEVLEGRRTSCD